MRRPQRTQSRRVRRILSLAVLGALTWGTALLADVHIYQQVDGKWVKVGRMKSEGNVSFLCSDGSCDYDAICSSCHVSGGAKPVASQGPLQNLSLHVGEFSRRAIRMTGGQPVPWGSAQLKLDGGRLTATGRSGQRVASLPADALVLPNRTGRATFVVYKGELAPLP